MGRSGAGKAVDAEEPLNRRPSPRRRFAFSAVTLALVFSGFLLCAEIGLRWLREGGFVQGARSLFQENPIPSNIEADKWIVPDPTLGYRLNETIDGVNSLSFRHAEVAAEKREGQTRVLVVGDSVAYPENGFVKMLRDSLQASDGMDIEVFNASVPGYTTFQERLFLERISAVVKPDLVLMQYCLNDNHRFLHRLFDGGSWLATTEARRALIPEGADLLSRVSKWSYLAFEFRRLLLQRTVSQPHDDYPWSGNYVFGPAWNAVSWVVAREHILAMAKSTRAAGAEFAVVAIPYEPQLRADLLQRDREYVMTPQRHLRSACEEGAIPLLDLHSAFERAAGVGLFSDGIHLTGEGDKIAFAELRDWLADRRLLPRAD